MSVPRDDVSAIDYDPFAGSELARVVPTTEPQREVWLAARLGDDASLAYNESVSLRLRGPLDTPALVAAVQAFVARHEALRGSLSANGEQLHIAQSVGLYIPVLDVSRLSLDDRETVCREARQESVDVPFDMESGPLVQARLLKLGDQDHLLVFWAHHIVCDGWSFGVLMRELGPLYMAAREARAPQLPPAGSFADYAVEQRARMATPEHAADEAYWLNRFSTPVPVLDLPADRSRNVRRGFASHRVDRTLSADLVMRLRKLGAQHGASLYATLLAGYAALLQRLSNVEDLVIGVPWAGQSIDSAKDRVVGHCVNFLAVRVQVDPHAPLPVLVKATQSSLLDAFEHPQYTYGTLLRKLALPRDPGRLPLVSVMFNLDQAIDQDGAGFGDLQVEFAGNARSHENFELFVNAVQVQGGLRLETQFNTDLYDDASVQRWLAAYETMLQDACAEPQRTIAQLAIIDPKDRALLSAWNHTPAERVPGQRVHELFEAQVARTPDQGALRWGTQRVTYFELNARADYIARCLRRRGVGVGSLVGLLVERCPDMVAALMGVLKAGGAYVPLDPAYPVDRLGYMVEDAKLAALVTQRHLVGTLPFDAARSLVLDGDADDADPRADDVIDALPAAHISLEERIAAAEQPAYVIYTSGSTGRPKGVQVPHRSTVNFIHAMAHEPGLRAGERIVAVTTLSFDIAVTELLLPLAVGAEIILASRDESVSGPLLAGLIEDHRAHVMQVTPAAWRLVLATGWRGREDFRAFCGGEALDLDLAHRLAERCGALWNLYGPTETTVWSTAWRVPLSTDVVRIGRPIDRTSVWIVDERGQLCPIGVSGEIVIAGSGVALGYLHRPDLTAERFIPDPGLDAAPGAMAYRTGDRGRWRNDGTLEHQGRIDFQIKVRGYRIEPGEIEAALQTHPAIDHALVATREDRAHDVRMVAYWIAQPGLQETPSDSTLREHLKSVLPEYMLPQHYVRLSEFPRLPNGKVDRSRLPAPDPTPTAKRAPLPPRTETEKAVAGAMETALGLPGLGVHDDFFMLGGHSLLAAQLAMQLATSLRTPVPMRAVFDAPTIESLAAWIDDARASADHAPSPEAQPIAHHTEQSRVPVSLMQQRLWFLEQLLPGRLTHHTPSAHRLIGPLDLASFEQAFNTIIERQSSLRTYIDTEDGLPVQCVMPQLRVALQPVEDLSGTPAEQREQVLAQRLRVHADQIIDLRRAPLFRVKLLRLAAQEHVLFFMPHHIIWDGWSFDLFYEEMAALYGALAHGQAPQLPALPVTYGDFARWQTDWLRSDDLARQLAHWKERLAHAGDPLDLPLDRPRPPRVSGNGETEPLSLVKHSVDAARRLGQRADATLFMTLLAIYYAMLHRLTGQTDLVVGTPVRGRNAPEIEKIMGFFVNALPLRLQLDPSRSMLDLIAQVKQVVLDAFSAPDVPFEHLVRDLDVVRDESRSAIYQAFFSFQDARHRVQHWGSLQQSPVTVFQRGAAEDIGIWFLEQPGGVIGGLSYNTDVLSQSSARRFRQRYQALLDAAIASPQTPIGRLAWVPDDEQRALLQWNRTRADYARELIAPALVSAQAAHVPQNAAVTCEGSTLRYAELEARTNQLAHALRRRGIRRGLRVGLCVNRGIDMLVAVLAIQKAGAAYVPLDPSYPSERLSYMASDAELALLITQSAHAAVLSWPAERRLLLDADAAQLRAELSTALPPDAAADATPADPAYVIYTSGSTGQPKGVLVPHRAVVNFLTSMAREPGMTSSDKLLAVTTLSFDISVLELLLPLTVGAEVVIATREEATDGRVLRDRIEEHRITQMQATPSTWRLLIDAGWQGSPDFKVLVGGEALPADLAAQLLALASAVWNMYGPTETTVWSTCWQVKQPALGVLIGKPIANTRVLVLDTYGQPCPIGVAGELCIGGDGVTLGYLNRPEQTAERYIADPADPSSGAIVYRTGDRGRWRDDGQLEHLGRLDQQLKVRGYRIEPGEIEHVLSAHPAVARALVTAREDRKGDVRLVAYLVQRSTLPPVAELREHLRPHLPDYMVPQHFVPLDAIPLLPNGKVDRKLLPSPVTGDSTPHLRYMAPRNATERALVGIWTELLDVGQISVHDNFFEIGGHSLLALQMFSRIERRFGINLPLATLLQLQTVAQIATLLPADENDIPAALGQPAVGSPRPTSTDDGEGDRLAWQPLVTIRRGGARPPLFCIHAVGGNVLNYRVLAAVLRPDQPVYGLQAVGLDGLARPLKTIEAMAARYIEEVRRVQPHGPYYLCGGSLGGTVAFEMAQQLHAAGERTALLALFDTSGPEMRTQAGPSEPDSTGAQWARNSRRMVDITRRGQWRRLAGAVAGRLRSTLDRLLVSWFRSRERPIPHGIRWRIVEASNRAAYYRYHERPYAGRLTLFRAVDEAEHLDAGDHLGWDSVAGGGIDLVRLPGTHREFIEQPDLGFALRQRLEQAQREAGFAPAGAAAPDAARQTPGASVPLVSTP